MSNFYKISLAAMVAAGMTVFGAGNIFAEASIKGGVDVGFGQGSNTIGAGDAVSGFSVHSQAQIDVSGGTDAVSAKYRLRVRETDKALAATRHHVNWMVNEQLSLTFMGSSFGLPGAYGGHLPVGYFDNAYETGTDVNGDTMYPGGALAGSGFENSKGLDIGYNLGSMAVGLAILTAGPGTQENSTMAPHFTGKFGSISVGVLITSGSGKEDDGTGTLASVTDGSTQIGGTFATDSMKVGLGIATTAWKAGTTEVTSSTTELGFQMAGVEFKYVTGGGEMSAGGTAVAFPTVTDMAVGYRMSIGDGASLVPAYASTTTAPEAGDGDAATWMGVQVGTSF